MRRTKVKAKSKAKAKSKVPPESVHINRFSSDNIAEALGQTDSARIRKNAIAWFGKSLRRIDRFQPTWDAVGGAAGLANLMAGFSVREVRYLCRWLGRTGSATRGRPERRKALGDLLALLRTNAVDKRPLRDSYQDIVPGCSSELVQEWEDDANVMWSPWQQKRLFCGHRELNEKTFLEDVFESYADIDFKDEKRLFHGNLPFCERVMAELIDKADDDDVRMPHDFMAQFAMPVLKRLQKRRFPPEMRQKYLDLIIQCLQKHPNALGRQLHVSRDGLVQFVIERWLEAPANRKDGLKERLAEVVKHLPTTENPLGLTAIHGAVLFCDKQKPDMRYELLRLFLLHTRGYNFDIEAESEEELLRLKNLPLEWDKWPVKLFFCIDKEKAMQLFDRLDKVYPGGEFLAPVTYRSENTVLRQTRAPDDANGDVEVVRSLLIRNLSSEAGHPGWLERARMLVQERRKKAQESREPNDRAFWTKSALNLCVASGDLEALGDTVLWARRYNKDALTVKDVYQSEVFQTNEIQALLGVIPAKDSPRAAWFTLDLAKERIETANRILVNLVETATMAVPEASFQSHDWKTPLRLPVHVVNWRLKHAGALEENLKKLSPEHNFDVEIMNAIWRPTVDAAVDMEALLSKPTSEPLGLAASATGVLGAHVLQGLEKAPAPVLAELTQFLLVEMRARLGAGKFRARVGDVVEAIVRVARGDRPSLACPFVEDMIMDEDDNSSWYRKLMNTGFLSSLPAQSAREFLLAMADAMTAKMREQNSRPKPTGSDSEQVQAPAIKVSTIKMMAQLLQGNVFIDSPSSCEILVRLLSEARHVDAQITIVNSLISTMEEPTCPPIMRKRILTAFEDYIVPVASQLSERRHLTEKDWQVALSEPDAKLPEIGEGTSLISMVADRVLSAQIKDEDKMRFAQLIMMTLERSAANNSRWMSLFLSKNNFGDEMIPTAPVVPFLLVNMLDSWTTYMPVSLFDMLRAVVFANIDPPAGMARITEAVKAKGDLLNSNAGQHWITHFDMGAVKLGPEYAAGVLQRPAEDVESKLEGDQGITAPMLQTFVLDAAERLIMTGKADMVEELVSKLCDCRLYGREQWKAWQSNCVPVIREIIGKVDKVRSELGSSSLLLPNTMRLMIKALPVPYCGWDEAAAPEETDAFISEVSAFIEQLVARPKPYHGDFAYLKEKVLETPRTQEYASFALCLADRTSSGQLTLADYLRLELARDLLTGASDPEDKQVVERVRTVVENWKTSQVEDLRILGVSVVEGLAPQGKMGWFSIRPPR